MSEHIFKVIPAAVGIDRYRQPRDGSPKIIGDTMVRCYRYSPDRVMLQIRGEKSYASVSLPFDVAKKVAAALVEECK